MCSGTPAAARAVAPPILKEWVFNELSNPKEAERNLAKRPRVRKVPLRNVKSGPGPIPLDSKNIFRAWIGHKLFFEDPMETS